MPLACCQGLDCNAKTIQLDEKNELKLVIWDTAGQEKYRALITNYFKDANGALIVFDLTVKESFEAVKTVWLEALKKNAPEKICKVILGNKCDRIGDIEVTDEEIFAFEKEYDIKCFKTSAKENVGICESFFHLAKLMSQTFLFSTSIEDKSEETIAVFNKNKCGEGNGKKVPIKKGIVIKKDDKFAANDNSDRSMGGCCE